MSTSPSTANNTTLFGFLGQDPIERWTPERTFTKMVPDPVVEEYEIEKEFTIPARPYWKLSLATHRDRKTEWHDCVIWNPENRTPVRNAHLARKGDRVAVIGRYEEYTFKKDGETVRRKHFVVEEFHFQNLRSKKPFTID